MPQSGVARHDGRSAFVRAALTGVVSAYLSSFVFASSMICPRVPSLRRRRDHGGNE